MAGYSSTPLAKKLGINVQSRVRTQHAPDNYLALIAPLPEQVTVSSRISRDIDIWHLFTRSRAGLAGQLEVAMRAIKPAGIIWVSWPKKASKVVTDMTEDEVRRAALPLGLVDVKVCAVDETWSGLKLVIRKALRPKDAAASG